MEPNLAEVVRLFRVFFLNTIKIKDIYNLIIINKEYKEIICEAYNGLFPSNLELLFFNKDPWNRNMSDELGILGMKALPETVDFNIPRFCIKNGLNQELFDECKSSDIYILFDNSRSTDFVFCEIEEGEFAGIKTKLDIMKMFISSLIEIMKSKIISINKVSIFTFNEEVQCLADYLDIEDININLLLDVESKGINNYDKAIKFIAKYHKGKNTYAKLLVIGDSFSPNPNDINNLKKDGITPSTFLFDGEKLSAEYILKMKNIGIHFLHYLQTFSYPEKVISICNYGAEFLTSKLITIITNDEEIYLKKKSMKYSSKIGQILTPIKKKEAMEYKVNDITGEHVVKLPFSNFSYNTPHEDYAYALEKMSRELINYFENLKDERSEFVKLKKINNKTRDEIKKLKKSIQLIDSFNLIKFLKKRKNSEINSKITKFQSIYRGKKERNLIKKMAKTYCTLEQADNWNKKIQRSSKYRKNKKCEIGSTSISLGFGGGNLELTLDKLSTLSPKVIKKIEENKIDTKNLLEEDLKNTINESELEIELENRTIEIAQKIKNIFESVLTGIALDNCVLKKTLFKRANEYNKKDYDGNNIIFIKDNIKEYIPIPVQYECYHILLCLLKLEINKIEDYIDKYKELDENYFFRFGFSTLQYNEIDIREDFRIQHINYYRNKHEEMYSRMKIHIQENERKKTQNTQHCKINKKKLIAENMRNSSYMRALSSGSDLN